MSLRRITIWVFLSIFMVAATACASNASGQDVTETNARRPGLEKTVPFSGATQEMPFMAATLAPSTEVVIPTMDVVGTPRVEPSFTPTSTVLPTPLTCWRRGGRTVTGSLSTKTLRLPLDYRIYLPPCYDFEPERRYPTLYLIHGQSFNDDQWERLGAGETVDRLSAAGEIAPFIIVMPRDRTGDQPPDDGFARAVVDVLLPYVDETYRTLPERSHRAVGGLSRGAGWAVHLAFAHWQLFGALGAHSPAIFYEDARLMRVYLDTIPAEQYPRIYIDVGDKDRPQIYDVAIWFEQLLNEWRVAHDWRLFVGFHEEAYWQSHIEKYIRWYAKEW